MLIVTRSLNRTVISTAAVTVTTNTNTMIAAVVQYINRAQQTTVSVRHSWIYFLIFIFDALISSIGFYNRFLVHIFVRYLKKRGKKIGYTYIPGYFSIEFCRCILHFLFLFLALSSAFVLLCGHLIQEVSMRQIFFLIISAFSPRISSSSSFLLCFSFFFQFRCVSFTAEQ